MHYDNESFVFPTSNSFRRSLRNLYDLRVFWSGQTKKDRRLFENLHSSSFDQIHDLANLAYVLSLYPVEFIQNLGLKKIRFADFLERRATNYYPYSSFEVSGTMDTHRGKLYTLSGDEAVLHHEIGHQIMATMDPNILEMLSVSWIDTNDSNGLHYIGFETAFKEYSQPRPNGFVSSYAQTDLSEDIPETLTSLMYDFPHHLRVIDSDHIVAKKTDLVLQTLELITDGAMDRNWRRQLLVHHSPQPFFLISEMWPFLAERVPIAIN